MVDSFIQNYLKRIGIDEISLKPTKENLFLLQTKHQQSITFENTYAYYGKEIKLTKEWLFDKIITQKRGGFCYELNLLFFNLLEELGYNVTLLSAGVHLPESFNAPPTLGSHILQKVEINGETFITDVAFVNRVYKYPLKLEENTIQVENNQCQVRLVKNSEKMWCYERQVKKVVDAESKKLIPDVFGSNVGEWVKQYEFLLTPCTIRDFEERFNYYTTNPNSLFLKKRYITKFSEQGLVMIFGSTLTKHVFNKNGNEEIVEKSEIAEEDFWSICKEYFEISLLN